MFNPLFSYNSLNLPSSKVPSNRDEWPPNAYRRKHFGQHVLWHEYLDDQEQVVSNQHTSHQVPRHLSAETLEKYRQVGDPAFDEILDLYAREGRPLQAGDDIFDRIPLNDSDIDTDATTNKNTQRPHFTEADRALQEMFREFSDIPSWVDLAQLQRGRDVFLAYFPAIGLSLYYKSLVPGFSIPKIAAVLQATAYLAPPASKTAVQERLLDTGAFLGTCLRSHDVAGILPGGEGWKSALRVRLLHAKVRRRLLSKTGNRVWDTHQLGVPINQEDMAATLLAFSTNSLLGCEMILGGRPLPLQDRLDYLALWRYLGWLLGVPVISSSYGGNDGQPRVESKSDMIIPLDPCGPGWYEYHPNPVDHSYAIFQSIIFHSLHPNEASVTISHHLLRQGRRKDGDNKAIDDKIASTKRKTKEELEQSDQSWFMFRSYQCRRFIGDELADALLLPLPSTIWGKFRLWCFSQLYFSIMTLYTIAGLPWSPFRRRLIAWHRKHTKTFVEKWNDSHLERMHKRIHGVSSNPNAMDNESLDTGGGIPKNGGSVCPFAMVLLPDNTTN